MKKKLLALSAAMMVMAGIASAALGEMATPGGEMRSAINYRCCGNGYRDHDGRGGWCGDNRGYCYENGANRNN